MTVEEALFNLKKCADEITMMGMENEINQYSREEFLYKWTIINQYYKYIINNSEAMSKEWYMAIDILSDIGINNPSMQQWISIMIEPRGNSRK